MEFICIKELNGILYKVFQSSKGTIYFEKVSK